MRDLPFREIAEQLLKQAMELLVEHSHLTPVVFVVGTEGLSVYAIQYGTVDEKYAAYKSLWAQVLPTNPECIITINDAFGWRPSEGQGLADRPASLSWAHKMGDPNVAEAVMLAVYPKGTNAWGIKVPYDRHNPAKRPVFGEPDIKENESGIEIGGGLGPQPWTARANQATEAYENTPKGSVQ